MSVDLLTYPDIDEINSLLAFAKKLGIECIGIPLEILDKAPNTITRHTRIIPRCILEITRGKLERRVYSNRKCLQAYKPTDTSSARRIPIYKKKSVILFDKSNIKFFDKSEAHLLAENDCIAEISLRDLLHSSRYTVNGINERIRYMRNMYKALSLASKYNVKVVFSSFAHTWWELWHRNSLICILTKLGLPSNFIKRSIHLAKTLALEAM
ncbi:MAG: hypothetical protein DRO15_00495 [Thermoprotei archaeon]|nr:MAG: hypothetical protein DRO15_00495 [Thermoprotei archaeon]